MTGFLRQLGLFWRAANASCKSHSKMASMRRDDALEPGERGGHRVHLMMCRGCRRYSEQMNEVSELLKGAGPVGEDSKAASAAGGMPAEVRERLKVKMGG